MKKLIFGLIATVLLSYNLNAQDKFTDDKNVLEVNKSNTVNAKISCKKFSVGVNILVAWVETDIYIACGFPAGSGIGGGTCHVVSERFCNLLGKSNLSNPTNFINIRSLVKDIDYSKVSSIEISKCTTWVDEDGTKSTLRTGKYNVDKNGDFEIEILNVK